MLTFYHDIRKSLDRIPSVIPMDEAVQGVSLSDAIIIDINDSVRSIASSDQNLEEIDFGAFYDVAPPLEGDNFFLQFHSRVMKKDRLPPGWVGIHCVNFELAKHSMLYRHFPDIPDMFSAFPKTYSFVVYRQLPIGLSTSQAAILLGIEPKGCVSLPGFIPMMIQKPSDNDLWRKIVGHDAWIIYLVLSSFGMVNQGEAKLRVTGQIYKI